MPLAGGAADKFGNRYEGRWTVYCVTEILHQRAIALRPEPLGSEGEGFEFWLSREGVREFHQTKRQRTASGRWTLADLQSEQILSHFWERLREADAMCVFVSSDAAYQLRELEERAKSAASVEEFCSASLRSDALRKAFGQLRGYWGNCSEEEAYAALRRVKVHTIDERALASELESRLATLVDGDPGTAVAVLAEFVLDNTHQTLTEHDIWGCLERHSLKRRDWARDLGVLAAVRDANQRYLDPLRRETLAGRMVPRDEAHVVVDKFTSPDGKRGVLLSGPAGVGKSGVIPQVVDPIIELGWPVLALRADRFEPDLSAREVGQKLGLPDTPARVLAAIAQDRDCLLVIDQLDAVSLASGRAPRFFESIEEILRQARSHPAMRVLLACRAFDLQNDWRLRQLTGDDGIADVVAVAPLPKAAVCQVVGELGLDAGQLTSKQLELLSLPLHLRLLADVARDGVPDALSFQTANDLYGRYWDHKRTVLRERLGHDARWVEVIETLCDRMNEEQGTLSAPVDAVDEWAADADAMASEHVLVRDGQRYAFFHEGFFDYAFARRFVGRGRDLLRFLRTGEQHLFRRAQVRQILLYERQADFPRYVRDLGALLTSSDVRFHLKQVILALLASFGDPTTEEWAILEPLLGNSAYPHAANVWQMVHGSVPWMRLLDRPGVLEHWLRDLDEALVDRAVTLLRGVQQQQADRVAELVEPFLGAGTVSERWRDRFVYLVQWSEPGAGRRFLELILRLLDAGVLDRARAPMATNSDFWDVFHRLPDEQPAWACEVIGHYLGRRLELARVAEQPNPFDLPDPKILPSRGAPDVFLRSARGAPGAFVDRVLPPMLAVMDWAAKRQGEPPWRDVIWQFRDPDETYVTQDTLLAATEAALRALALDEPEAFATLAESLREQPFETVQYLLIRGYAANGPRFADEAAAYLCERSARLQTGYVSDSHWATRELLEAITPHCSPEWLARLEQAILDYYPDGERGSRSFGYAQRTLLEGITPARRSPAVTRRLEEWGRKFTIPVAPPVGIVTGVVGSPIPEAAADKMSDAQWLSAVMKYNRDRTEYRPDHRFVGGAHELALLLQDQVRREPGRFAELVCKFPDDAHPAYFGAVLDGLKEADLDAQVLLRVWQRCHSLPGRPCGRAMCRSIEHHASRLGELGRPLPAEASEIVAWYATEDPDPERELWRTEAMGGKPYYGGDILSAGINCVRAAAAGALALLIFYDGSRLVPLAPALNRIVRDPSIAVRAAAARTLQAVLNDDRDLAVRRFLELCETEDVLLKTGYIGKFLDNALRTHLQVLTPVLERMLASVDVDVQTAGAWRTCIASLLTEEANELVVRCLDGSVTQRRAAAEVFAANLRPQQFRAACDGALRELFHDSDETVRSAAAQCFRDFVGEELGEHVELIETFVDSPAFAGNEEVLLHALEKTTARLPDLAVQVCEHFLRTAGTDAGDIRTRAAGEAHTASGLLIRVYNQATEPATKAHCLDVIDRMMEVGAYGMGEALVLFER